MNEFKVALLAAAALAGAATAAFGEIESAPKGWIHSMQPLRTVVARKAVERFGAVEIGGAHIPPEGILWLLENGVLKGVRADKVIIVVGPRTLAAKGMDGWKAKVESLVKAELPSAALVWSDKEKGDRLPPVPFWPPKDDAGRFGFREIANWTAPEAKDGVLTVTGSPMEVGWQLREMCQSVGRGKMASPDILVLAPTANYLLAGGDDPAVDVYLATRNLMSYASGLKAKRYIACTFPVPAGASDGLKARLAAVNAALLAVPFWNGSGCVRVAACDAVDAKIAELRAEGLGPMTTIARDRLDVKWWKERFERNLSIISTNGEFDVVFVGDSITHRWNGVGRDAYRDVLGAYKHLNAGYIGDLTQHMVWRLKHGELDGYTAKMFMVMAGTNNQWTEPSDVAAGVQEVVKIISEKHPESKILLLAIFPRGATPKDAERVRVTKANEILEPWAKTLPNVIWADLKDRFLSPDGTISKDVFPDALHPEHDGYYIWAKAVKPYFEKLIGAK